MPLAKATAVGDTKLRVLPTFSRELATPSLRASSADFLAGVEGLHDIGKALGKSSAEGQSSPALGRAQAVDAELAAVALQARGVGFRTRAGSAPRCWC